MAKLINPKIEMLGIFTVLDGREENVRLRMLSQFKDDHFGYSPVKEIYQAVKKGLDREGRKGITGKHTGIHIPSSRALRHSPGLSDAAKNILKEKKRPLNSRHDIDKLYDDLEFYRKLRKLYETTRDILTDLSKEPEKIQMDDVRAKVAQAAEDLQDPNQKRLVVALDSDEGQHIYKNVFKKKKKLYGTGFKNFDSKALGYEKGDMVMLAANTGGGKSIMAMNIAVNDYMKYNLNVVIVTLELTEEQYLGRLLSNISGIDYDKIRKGICSHRERKEIDHAWHRFLRHGRKHHCKFRIVSPGQISALDLMLLLKVYEPNVIVIDNINDLEHIKGDSDWSRLGNSAVTIKDKSKDMQCLTYCCCHVTEDNRIAYSKILKEKSDGVWLWTCGEEEKTAGQVKVNQVKARHFETFSFFLTPEFKTQCFLDSAGPPVLDKNEDEELLNAMKQVPN